MANRYDNERERMDQGQDRGHERERGEYRQGGYYQDPNRSMSGRDAEFGGNQGMGSYSQSSEYGRHMSGQSGQQGQYGQGQQGYYGQGGGMGHGGYQQGSGQWNQDQSQGGFSQGGYDQVRYGQGGQRQGQWSRGGNGQWGQGQGNYSSSGSVQTDYSSQRGNMGVMGQGQRGAGEYGIDQGTFGTNIGNQGTSFGSYGGGLGQYQPSQGRFSGRGPKGYQRSDERIREEVCERLTHHGEIDASEIEVQVRNGEVTLAGSVDDRRAKRLAEDVAHEAMGVRDVHNQIRVQQGSMAGTGSSSMGSTSSTSGGTSGVTGTSGSTSGTSQNKK